MLCLKAGNTVFSARVLHGIGQDVQELPFLALDQAFLFLLQGTPALGDVLINLRGVIEETVTLLSLCCCTICCGLKWNLKLCSGIHLSEKEKNV